MRVIKEVKKDKLFNRLEKIRVCAYVRVSTENPGQLSSFKNQLEYYGKEIKRNPSHEYIGIFSDYGVSGVKDERPGFNEMMERARVGDIDLIITKSISRFSRNTVVLLKYVRELKELGIGVIFEEQKINTLHSEGELMLTVLGAIAAEEQKAVRSNVRWSIQRKYKNGEPMINTNRLLGYSRDKKGQIIIDKEQAKIIKMIYKMYLEGASSCKIANKLREDNIPKYTNRPLDSSRILSIISNEKYKGDVLMQKTFINEDGKEVINRGQREKYYIENSHPAIISKEDWERAQVIRNERKTKTYPFTGLIKCPYCGASLIRVNHQRKWVSWICATYMQKGKASCIGMRISNNKLEKLTSEMILKEPMVLKEDVGDDKKEKNFYLIPNKQ